MTKKEKTKSKAKRPGAVYEYHRDDVSHVYGESSRLAAESLFVKRINGMKKNFPEFEMMLMGTSGVHGERFPIYQTECDFELESEDAVELCRAALKESDELIRRRLDGGHGPRWNWESAWRSGNRLKFFVNWFDTAYFLKFKDIFLARDHARYAMDFGLDVNEISFSHYRIDEDANYEEFSENLMTEREANVAANLDEIPFNPRKYTTPRM